MTPDPLWVDFGLPSGLKWGRMNVGASSPSDEGLYFSWGNTQGFYITDPYNFSVEAYDASPGKQISVDLTLENDAARAVMGSPWRMPSQAEAGELMQYCTFVWGTLNGRYGLLLTSTINGQVMFLPAAGYLAGESRQSFNGNGHFWTSSFFNTGSCYDMYLNSERFELLQDVRRLGFPIRPVYDPT